MPSKVTGARGNVKVTTVCWFVFPVRVGKGHYINSLGIEEMDR
jgi:hypothetical protein